MFKIERYIGFYRNYGFCFFFSKLIDFVFASNYFYKEGPLNVGYTKFFCAL